MNSLADAQTSSPGRWVLMPRNERVFRDAADRRRYLVRRRRRQLFMVLLELTVLALLMSLFPPFHKMLYATGVLAGVLLVYVLVLVKLRADEIERVRARRAMEAAVLRRARAHAGEPVRSPAPRQTAARGARASNGHTKGALAAAESWAGIATPAYLREGGVRIVDDDVHVVVYRSDEFDARALRSATR